MQPRDDITRVRHMLEAAEEACEFIGQTTFEEFRKNRQIAHAVMRTLEIIGEAASQISPEFQNKHPEIAWRTIIGMRNRLVHAYFDINFTVVWETVRDDLPPFITQLKTILDKSAS
jgi:uncharacterized protein with HEPN domain